MRKIFLFLVLVIGYTTTQAQIVSYFVNKECSNGWDNGMNAWTGWGKWRDISNERPSSSIVKISPNAVQYNYAFNYWDEKQDKYYSNTQTVTYTFLNDIAGTSYPFNKNVSVSYVEYVPNKDDYDKREKITYTGTGTVYSKYTLAQLLSGNVAGEIYLYRDLGSFGKAYFGEVINSKKAEDLANEKADREQVAQDRADEIAEAKAEKKRKELESYKNLGRAIGTLLQKKN